MSTARPARVPARICKSLTKNGAACKGHALPGSDFCLSHDPKRAAKLAEARSRGGQARHGRKVLPEAKPVKLTSTADILLVVEQAINNTLLLENSVQRNRTIGMLAMAALKAFEISDLAKRIAAIEQITQGTSS